MKPRELVALTRDTFNGWSADRAPRLGAALAYYTIFSIAPMLIIAIAMCALFFGEQAARGHVAEELSSAIGAPAAEAIQEMIQHTSREGRGPLATVVGVVTLFCGALGVFGQLQDALNTIWKVDPMPGRGWLLMIQDRLLSFVMLLLIGVLLFVSLLASMALQILKVYSSEFIALDRLPGGLSVWQMANAGMSFIIVTVLFAMIFKVLPDVRIGWRDVIFGAIVTALLFTGGKYVLGLYLGRASVTSAYGAAGSLVVILIWVYYSSQILLFGAEFTRAYALRRGAAIVPRRHAVFVTGDGQGHAGQGAASRKTQVPPSNAVS